jgi:hypothetical protein
MDPIECDGIEVKYSKDLKIRRIHEVLMMIFDRYTLEALSRELKERKSLLDYNQQRIDFLQNLIDTYDQRHLYFAEADLLLDEYSKLSKTVYAIDIYNLGKQILEDPEVVERRVAVIERYLDLVSTFVVVHRNRGCQKLARCPSCNEHIEKAEETNGMSVCSCGYQISVFASLSSSGLSSTKTNYDDRNNFIRGMRRIQGKSAAKFPEDLCTRLDEYFERTGGPSRKSLEDVPLDCHGEKPDTTMEIMKVALHNTGFSAYYNEIPFINHLYWGWTLMDFGDREAEMLELYDETQPIYENIPEKERTASLTMNFRIYGQLLQIGWPARRERFLLQDSEKSLELHQKYFKIMIVGTGRKYVPIPI